MKAAKVLDSASWRNIARNTFSPVKLSQTVRNLSVQLTTIRSSADQQMLNGGKAYDTTISNGGTQYADSGLISGTMISNGGRQDVRDGHVVGVTVENGGIEVIHSGATAVG